MDLDLGCPPQSLPELGKFLSCPPRDSDIVGLGVARALGCSKALQVILTCSQGWESLPPACRKHLINDHFARLALTPASASGPAWFPESEGSSLRLPQQQWCPCWSAPSGFWDSCFCQTPVCPGAAGTQLRAKPMPSSRKDSSRALALVGAGAEGGQPLWAWGAWTLWELSFGRNSPHLGWSQRRPTLDFGRRF